MVWIKISKDVILTELSNSIQFHDKCEHCKKQFREGDKIIKIIPPVLRINTRRVKLCVSCIKPFCADSLEKIQKFNDETLEGLKKNEKKIMVMML